MMARLACETVCHVFKNTKMHTKVTFFVLIVQSLLLSPVMNTYVYINVCTSILVVQCELPLHFACLIYYSSIRPSYVMITYFMSIRPSYVMITYFMRKRSWIIPYCHVCV